MNHYDPFSIIYCLLLFFIYFLVYFVLGYFALKVSCLFLGMAIRGRGKGCPLLFFVTERGDVFVPFFWVGWNGHPGSCGLWVWLALARTWVCECVYVISRGLLMVAEGFAIDVYSACVVVVTFTMCWVIFGREKRE
ncbi:hypothetical protein FN846DRAFT_484580 [Sphaerosporella brunnea]|uniref:Uncharacterized protein n=1 Tax=Sphaerosporella brunnea TaxID=1250544 RepID=A0A5J5F3V3_9PEZI|nr:hypothetical protein FN846DRAFT_484580 [Sphaerosporella brunnea]